MRPGPVAVAESPKEQAILCEEEPYPRYPAGTYEAQCVKATQYKDPRFRTWKCRLDLKLLPSMTPIAAFLNLGRDEKPRVPRGSEYRRVWVMATGRQPRRREILSRFDFVGVIFSVKVADTVKRWDGRMHLEPEIYSTVKGFLERTCSGRSELSSSKASDQTSTRVPNHPIKEGMR